MEIFRSPEVRPSNKLARAIPPAGRTPGGRKRDYPDFMLLVYEALISVYGSARQVEAELAHWIVWRLLRRRVKKMFPNHPQRHLPRRHMRRHHYLYGRNRYLADPHVLKGIAELHRKTAAEQARELGLLDPGGPGRGPIPTSRACSMPMAR